MSTAELVGGMCDAHGDEHLRETPQADLDAALDDVVQCIVLFRQYPQPRTYLSRLPARPVEFDLYDWLQDGGMDSADLLEYAMLSMTDFSPEFAHRRVHWTSKLEAALRDYLTGSDIVARRAAQMAEEAREIEQEARRG